jgi:hypothetical protein
MAKPLAFFTKINIDPLIVALLSRVQSRTEDNSGDPNVIRARCSEFANLRDSCGKLRQSAR